MMWSIGLLLAAASVVLLVSRETVTVSSEGTSNRRAQGSVSSPPLINTLPRIKSAAPSGGPTLSDYKNAFARSANYWRFARDTLPAAIAGNADAQFYLSRALEYCTEHNSLYFQRRGKPIGLDEALQYAAQRHLPIDIAQDVYNRCHEFVDHDVSELGRAPDWLAQATASGQPLAQAITATKLLMQESQQAFVRAGGLPNPNNAPTVSDGSDPRELLRAAVQSKEPEVLFSIGDALTLMAPSTNSDNNTTRFAWWLVACQRGLDCSANAEWVKNSCANFPQCAAADGPSDLVQTLAGDKWPEVEERAQEINASLDQGKWGELGLGS